MKEELGLKGVKLKQYAEALSAALLQNQLSLRFRRWEWKLGIIEKRIKMDSTWEGGGHLGNEKNVIKLLFNNHF